MVLTSSILTSVADLWLQHRIEFGCLFDGWNGIMLIKNYLASWHLHTITNLYSIVLYIVLSSFIAFMTIFLPNSIWMCFNFNFGRWYDHYYQPVNISACYSQCFKCFMKNWYENSITFLFLATSWWKIKIQIRFWHK